MKMRLKSRQTTVSTTPTTASADITENRMTSIKNTSSLGIPAGYRERWEEKERERRGEEREGNREGRGEGGTGGKEGGGRERKGERKGKGARGMVSGIRPHKAWGLTPPSLHPLTREDLSSGHSELYPIGCEVGLSNANPYQLPRRLHPVLLHCCADIHRVT